MLVTSNKISSKSGKKDRTYVLYSINNALFKTAGGTAIVIVTTSS